MGEDEGSVPTIVAALVTELATLVVATIDDESVVQSAARLCAELDPAARRVHRSVAGPWLVETGDVVP